MTNPGDYIGIQLKINNSAMNNIIKSILLVGLLIFSACESLEEINIDPTRPTDVDIHLMLPEAISQTFFNQGTNPARVAGIIMQQLRGFDAQQVAYTDYGLPDVTFNNYWRTGLYAGSLRSAQLILDKANAADAPHYAGIAKILLAVGYGDATSYFGDIPLTEALQGIDNLKPAYDTQEQVYASVQSLLDAAIIDLSGEAGPIAPEEDDLIFGGSATNWIATANALKARYLMQTIKRNPGVASTILDLVQNKSFLSGGTEPSFTWGNAQTDNNPLAKFGVDRPNTLIIDGYFSALLAEKNDPRFEAFMIPEVGEDPNTPQDVDTLYYQYYGDSRLHFAQNSSTIPLVSKEEMSFIEAELLLMNGDEAGAKAAMSVGINANMGRIGVDGGTYIAAAEEAYDAAGNNDGKLEVIINEAYTSYYGHAFNQTWANYRRTGYPNLTPSPNGDTGLNPGGEIPKRYIYPISESETNADNLQIAIDRQGGALMNIALWAFQ